MLGTSRRSTKCRCRSRKRGELAADVARRAVTLLTNRDILPARRRSAPHRRDRSARGRAGPKCSVPGLSPATRTIASRFSRASAPPCRNAKSHSRAGSNRRGSRRMVDIRSGLRSMRESGSSHSLRRRNGGHERRSVIRAAPGLPGRQRELAEAVLRDGRSRRRLAFLRPSADGRHGSPSRLKRLVATGFSEMPPGRRISPMC